MKKYRTGYFDNIVEIEVIKETDSHVWFMENGKEKMEAKITKYRSWHDTLDHAKNYIIINQCDREIDRLQKIINGLEELRATTILKTKPDNI